MAHQQQEPGPDGSEMPQVLMYTYQRERLNFTTGILGSCSARLPLSCLSFIIGPHPRVCLRH
jgi:hypothetical protein